MCFDKRSELERARWHGLCVVYGSREISLRSQSSNFLHMGMMRRHYSHMKGKRTVFLSSYGPVSGSWECGLFVLTFTLFLLRYLGRGKSLACGVDLDSTWCSFSFLFLFKCSEVLDWKNWILPPFGLWYCVYIPPIHWIYTYISSTS